MKKHLLSALLAMCLVTTAFAQQGKVYETRTVKSKILGMERSYSIYLQQAMTKEMVVIRYCICFMD